MRAIIAPSEQTHFLKSVRRQLNLTWREMAKVCRVSERTLYRWINEESPMYYETLLFLHEQSGVSLPTIIEIITEKERQRRAGQKRIELYGNPGTPEGRSKGGRRLWQLRREHPDLYPLPPVPIGWNKKQILTPLQCPLLAEFACILLGDGHIGDKEIYINLHGTYEIEYAEAVALLFKELFKLEATIEVRRDHTRRVRVWSVALIDYLESIGLCRGNKVKQQVGVPTWIRLGEKDHLIAGVRGLMDTDGGPILQTDRKVFKTYRYVMLGFHNFSTPLLDGMWEMLTKLHYHPTRDARHVRLNRQEEVKRYYREIGTRNAYHLQRYIELARTAWKEDVSNKIKFLG